MSVQPDIQVLRIVRWQIVFAGAFALLCGAALALVVGRGSGVLAMAGCALLTIGALAAFAHAITTRIALRPEGLEIVHNFRRRLLPREAIETVRWERGSGVALKLVGGDWVKLPETGHENQHRAEKIRAWLKRPQAIGDGTRRRHRA